MLAIPALFASTAFAGPLWECTAEVGNGVVSDSGFVVWESTPYIADERHDERTQTC